ncbi:MAG: sensor histidine kinase [Micromonosporaceae bacterium]
MTDVRRGRFRFPQSIRFRLTVMYSTVLFVLAALVLGGIYLGVSKTVEATPIETRLAKEIVIGEDGVKRYKGTVEVADVREIENNVNFQTLQTLRTYSMWTLGGLFLASLGIGWVLSGRALRPVRAIARTAEEIQATDLARRINLPGPRDELRYLADTIDSMLGRLENAFTAQRRLIDDASHELRTPLAIIRANLDAAVVTPDATEEERRRAVTVIDRATTRMTHLVEDLLATARRSAQAYADTDVDLADVAREAGEEFAALAARHSLSLRYDLAPGLTLIGDHDALRRAVGNLLSNSVRMAPADSEIVIGAGRTDSWLWLAVRDTGPGIAPEDQTRVFNRFWRSPSDSHLTQMPTPLMRHARDSAPAPERHTGLGLAIVRQIVESHGGHVRLFSQPDAGSTFVLWLPGPTSGQPTALLQHNPLPPD